MGQGYSYCITVHFVEEQGDMIHLGTQHCDPMFLRLPRKYFDPAFIKMCAGQNLHKNPLFIQVHKTAAGIVDSITEDEKICFSRTEQAYRADLKALSPKAPSLSVIARMLDHFMER